MAKTTAKKLNITPLHDRVIVMPAAAEEKSAGGIIIPDTAKEKPQRGVVLAAGTEIQIEGQDLLIMRESDILAIV